MDKAKSIEVNAANGYRYMFVEGWFGIIQTYYWDKFFNDWKRCGKEFKSFEEALAWADSFSNPVEVKAPIKYDDMDLSDYYANAPRGGILRRLINR